MGRRPRDDLAGELARIAVEAGAAILAVRAGGFSVARKDDASPVTEADARAEEIILRGLTSLAGDIPVLAEEAAARGDIPLTEDRFFLVDPLDGTREFIDGRDEFTVNIALIEAGRPVAGVVCAPATGMLALGDRTGARETGLSPSQDLAQASWRRIATRQPDRSGLVAVASRSHRDRETNAFLDTLPITDTRSAGSSLKFVVVARGDADVYPRFGRTMEWDTAAGHAVLSAAGGAVITADGAELAYGKQARGFDNPAFVAWGKLPPDARF